MITISETGNKRVLAFAKTIFDTTTDAVEIQVWRTIAINQPETGWEEQEEFTKFFTGRTLTKTNYVNATTGAFCDAEDEGAISGFNYIYSRTGAQIGMTSLDDPVFPYGGAAIEAFCTANNLWPEA